MLPLESPQLAGVELTSNAGSFTITSIESSTEQAPSVTVTKYVPAARFVKSSVEAVKPSGPVQLKDGFVELLIVNAISPFDVKQLAGVADKTKIGSSTSTITESETIHKPSVTVTEYVPSANPIRSSDVEEYPLGPVQLKEGILAFVTDKSIEPLEAPQAVGVEVRDKIGSFVVTSTESVETQLAEVTVTEYKPAERSDKSSVDAVKPFGPAQLNVGLIPLVIFKAIVPVVAPHSVGVDVSVNKISSVDTFTESSTTHVPEVTVTK
jgi:hypothetical protein